MSKNYDLYPASERKIDNWRRRILGYEKMKRDLQRQIQLLKNKNKKQKEAINKITEIINYYGVDKEYNDNIILRHILKDMLDILKEVSE